MSITRLQKARQMYAMGKLVERVGFQGGGRDAGAGSGFGDGPSSSGGNNDRPTMADIAGPVSTTSNSTKENDNTNREKGLMSRNLGPKGTTGNINDFTDSTGPDRSKVSQFSEYGINKFNQTFAPTVTKKTMFDRVKQILNIASVLSPHTLAGKIGLGLTTFDRAKTGLQTVSSIADTFGINTDSIKNSLSNNFSGKKSNTTTNTNTTNNGGDGEGLASLKNQASGYDEYVLLLQKLQSGNITDEERTRYTMLKNMLGI